MRNLLWLVLDSARWDSAVAARTPTFDRIGTMERRWSYASWTAPSHLNFFMGLLPHKGVPGAAASVQYREEFARWGERLDVSRDCRFSSFAPSLSLPSFLKQLGYRCEARVSMPVLNPATLLAAGFDHYELLPEPNDVGAALRRCSFEDGPVFNFINTGETHYPYLLPGETSEDLPVLCGVHGVWRSLDEAFLEPRRLRRSELRPLWEKQVRCVEHVDDALGRALAEVPPDTWIIVTSDHGELFGEGGWVGHGPVLHPKVLEVFLVEGLKPA